MIDIRIFLSDNNLFQWGFLRFRSSKLDLRTAIDLADSLDTAQKESASYSSCKVPATISAIADCKEDNSSAKTESPTVALAVQKKRTVERQTVVFLLWGFVESHSFELPCSGQHLQGMRNQGTLFASLSLKQGFSSLLVGWTWINLNFRRVLSFSRGYKSSGESCFSYFAYCWRSDTKALLDCGTSRNFIGVSFVRRLGNLAESCERIAMASTSLYQSLLSTLTIDINAAERTYKNVTFRALRFLCSDVILGQEFMKLHSEVNI